MLYEWEIVVRTICAVCTTVHGAVYIVGLLHAASSKFLEKLSRVTLHRTQQPYILKERQLSIEYAAAHALH
jgi:hypothetical protein